MDCVATFQFIGIMLQIMGFIVIIAQAIRSQLRIDDSVTMNKKGNIVIGWRLTYGIALVIAGLFLQALMIIDVRTLLCDVVGL